MRSDPKTYWSEAHQAKMAGLYEQQLQAEQGGQEFNTLNLPPTTTPSNGEATNE
jgi:hypothetical protein